MVRHAVYKSLAEVPRSVDFAIIVVPKERVPDTLRDCSEADIHAAVIITAGFGETGPEGKALGTAILSVAHAGGVRIVGPNTMGIYSAYPSRMQRSWPPRIQAGCRCRFITERQSGNVYHGPLYRREIGLSRLSAPAMRRT